MRISASAWSKWTGTDHTIFAADLDAGDVNGYDGKVQMKLKSAPLSLSGEYQLIVTLTSDEVARLYRESLTGALVKEIEALKKEISSLKAEE